MHRVHVILVGLLLSLATDIVTAQQPGTSAARSLLAVSGTARHGVGATVAPKPGTLAIIQGNAVGTIGEALSQVPVRLRDARMGRDIEIEITDRTGFFTFAEIEPGSYIVELLADDRRVLSTSEIIHVGGGDTAATIVRLSGRPTGASNRGAIAALSAIAAGAGVLGKTATGSPVSPRQ
jgi:hypothetical protein